MKLVDEILKGLLPEDEEKTVAIYAGGFKPPTKGHFQVIKQALEEHPDIDELLIYIGKKERGGITQAQSLLVWEIYANYLPLKVELVPTSTPPIKAVYNYAKNNPETNVLWIIGAREGDEEDFGDIASRTKAINNYPNIALAVTVTTTGASGTAARNAANISIEKLIPLLPSVISDKEAVEVYNIITNKISEKIIKDKIECDNCGWSWKIKDGGNDLYICHKCDYDNTPKYSPGWKRLNENASYSKDINFKDKIIQLTKHMLDKGMNIEPLPKVKFVDGDSENARDFFGKTAYYNPDEQLIVLYTEGRHPKDIVRSFAHEMIHHIQYLEDRLGNISGTNTTEDDHLDKLEQEANLRGTMTFRNWTDSIDSDVSSSINEGPQFGVLYHFTQYLLDILDDNILRGPISLTRSLDSYATEWLGDQPYFILDKDKLRTKYKIRPFKDTSDNPDYEEISQYDEMEEVIDTDIINLSKYIIKVVLPHSDEEWEDALKEKGIPYEIGKPLNEGKVKDPFGLNAYARELATLREDDIEYKIFSDMDGVITDFDESFKKASDGIAPRDYEKKFGINKFWGLIDSKGVGFWVGMPYMSDGEQYWNYIKDYDVELLSSPSRSESSRLGKRLWVRNNMPGVKLTLAYSADKQKYAAPNHILIDDRKSNIDQWVSRGGVGILHTSTADTIRQLKKLGL
jgi:hypothetical protein